MYLHIYRHFKSAITIFILLIIFFLMAIVTVLRHLSRNSLTVLRYCTNDCMAASALSGHINTVLQKPNQGRPKLTPRLR